MYTEFTILFISTRCIFAVLFHLTQLYVNVLMNKCLYFLNYYIEYVPNNNPNTNLSWMCLSDVESSMCSS